MLSDHEAAIAAFLQSELRRTGLFRWGLGEGLRLVKPMNLMTMGEYQPPRASWFPSVLY